MTDFSNELKRLITDAKKRDPRCQVFDADHHQYNCTKPATMRDIQDAEKKLGVKLPQALVEYYTQVSNGGVGPDYGIYPVQYLYKKNTHLKNPNFADKVIFEYENWEDLWNEELNKTYSISKYLRGLLIISTQGCTFDTAIICEGEYTGRMCLVDWNIECGPELYSETFEEWMINYLKR